MAIEFKLPDVGEGLHEAELLKWMVNEGDFVREDQPLMEVQTDKAAVEITAPVSGKVTKLIGKVGEILNIGSVVVVFDDGNAAAVPGEKAAEAAVVAAAPAPAQVAPKAEAAVAPAPAPTAAAAPTVAPTPGQRALAAPATRKLARELGVAINQVPGSGPAGRVTPADVKQFAAGGAPTAAAAPTPGDAAPAAYLSAPGAVEERLPLKGIRKVIADRMVQSKHTAAHVTIVEEVDMTDLAAFRERAKEMAGKKGVKLSFMPFIFKALTTALKEFPYLNASIDDAKQEVVLKKQYHLGFALDTEAGLLVPVVRDADKKSIFQIAAEMNNQIDRGRIGKLQPDELKGSTFTVSNMGSVGGLFFTPVINYPEVAILGIGKTQERPVVQGGQIVVRKMAYLSLSFDHRLIDGALATRFITRVVELLANPTLLMMEAM